MSEGDPGLRHKVGEATFGDKAVVFVSGAVGVASGIAGTDILHKGIHTAETAVMCFGSLGLALGSGFVLGSKIAQIEKQSKNK